MNKNRVPCPNCEKLAPVKGKPAKLDIMCKRCKIMFSAQRIYRPKRATK